MDARGGILEPPGIVEATGFRANRVWSILSLGLGRFLEGILRVQSTCGLLNVVDCCVFYMSRAFFCGNSPIKFNLRVCHGCSKLC